MLAQFSAKETGQEQLSIPVNVKGGSNASVFHRASVTNYKASLGCGIVMVLWFPKAR